MTTVAANPSFNLTTSLADMVNADRFGEIPNVLAELKVINSTSFDHCTGTEVRRFVRALIGKKQHSLIKEYMPAIVKVLTEAEDFNALLLIRENPKLYGELPAEGVAVIEKYAAARERAKVIFAERSATNGEREFSKTEGDLTISFKNRSLLLQFAGGWVYTVFRFDS
jgi:hypothetical protein